MLAMITVIIRAGGPASREPVESYDLEAAARATRLADACVILIAIITSDRKSRMNSYRASSVSLARPHASLYYLSILLFANLLAPVRAFEC